MDRLLTPAEVAAATGISVATLATWRSIGKGPAFHKLGGAIRYAEADVEQWVSSNRHDPAVLGESGLAAAVVRARTGGRVLRLGGHRTKADQRRSGDRL